MSEYNAPAIRKTMADYCAARDRVRSLIEQGYRALDLAEQTCTETIRYGFPWGARPKESLEHSLRDLDARFWQSFFEHTGLPSLMDAKAIDEFKRQLGSKETPDFTEPNIQATFLDAYQRREEMFARGVYETFRRVDRKAYRTNEREKFKLGAKLVLTCWFESQWHGDGLSVNYNRADDINDIDRCFRVLGGLPYQPGGLRDAMNTHFQRQRDEPFENDLYKVRGFGNGNAHVWFKRLDLLDKVNETIGAYCDGRAIPNAA